MLLEPIRMSKKITFSIKRKFWVNSLKWNEIKKQEKWLSHKRLKHLSHFLKIFLWYFSGLENMGIKKEWRIAVIYSDIYF